MSRNSLVALFAASFLFFVFFIVITFQKGLVGKSDVYPFIPGSAPKISVPFEKFTRFSSDTQFREYIQRQQLRISLYGGAVVDRLVQRALTTDELTEAKQAGVSLPERVSTTNVQVTGIDEPDIVKTNGQQLFFSKEGRYFFRDVPTFIERSELDVSIPRKILPPALSAPETSVVQIFPVSSLKTLSAIKDSGTLLLSGSTLAVFNQEGVFGYDVSNPALPAKSWSIQYKGKSSLVAARLINGNIYAVTQTSALGSSAPCPIRPFTAEAVELVIKCTDIYYPVIDTYADSIYTASVINPRSGRVEKKVSFVGSSQSSPVYMSDNALYITYQYSGDMVAFVYNFAQQNKTLFASDTLEKLRKLASYDISRQAQLTELGVILERMRAGLSEDEQLKFENEMQNAAKNYVNEYRRELETTGIVKIDLKNMRVRALGAVPGSLLNQFALDEYKGNLRVATTVSGNSWVGYLNTQVEPVNDIYVLNGSLDKIGEVLDLGRSERIYSVRFIGPRGYLVTFREVDPLYVLDLSNPRAPRVTGELKIPGYSSYLHPLSENLILGVGKEGAQIKLSLFDVANPASPVEVDKYALNEFWSDVLTTHHAFLADPKYQVFFMPGSRGGYIFSYKNNQLELVKTISERLVKRAVYVNDYLYIIGEQNIVVLDENTWERVGEVAL